MDCCRRTCGTWPTEVSIVTDARIDEVLDIFAKFERFDETSIYKRIKNLSNSRMNKPGLTRLLE